MLRWNLVPRPKNFCPYNIVHVRDYSYLCIYDFSVGMTEESNIFWMPKIISCTCPLSDIIAQVYRLSAVHCELTRYSQRVPGYLTRYFVSANEITFDKKISQSDYKYSSSPLGDFNRLFESQIGALLKYDIEIWFIFLNGFNLELKCKFVALLCSLKQAECSVHFTIKSKQTWFSRCSMPIGTIHHEHTKYGTYQQQCTGSKCS